MKKNIKQYRKFLKDSLRIKIDFSKTDQSLGIEPPLMQKPFHDPPANNDGCGSYRTN
jgi:hypothetical protein